MRLVGHADPRGDEEYNLALGERRANAAKDFLVEKGYDPAYGARPMRRSVERHLEDPLAEELLRGALHEGEPIQVVAEEGKLVFRQEAAAEGALSS